MPERAQLCFQRVDLFRPILNALEFLHKTQQRAVGERNQLPIAPCIRKRQGERPSGLFQALGMQLKNKMLVGFHLCHDEPSFR